MTAQPIQPLYICQIEGSDPFIAAGKGGVLEGLKDLHGGSLDKCVEHGSDLTAMWISDIGEMLIAHCTAQPLVYGADSLDQFIQQQAA